MSYFFVFTQNLLNKNDFNKEFAIFSDILRHDTEYCAENCCFNSIKPEKVNNCNLKKTVLKHMTKSKLNVCANMLLVVSLFATSSIFLQFLCSQVAWLKQTESYTTQIKWNSSVDISKIDSFYLENNKMAVSSCLVLFIHNRLMWSWKCDLIKIVSTTVKTVTWLSVVQLLDCKQGFNRSLYSVSIVN